MPISGADGEFVALIDKLGSIDSADNVTKAPFYGVRGGIVYQDIGLFARAGERGDYWSSTPRSTGNYAYSLFFSSSVSPSYNGTRRDGSSVRCVAR